MTPSGPSTEASNQISTTKIVVMITKENKFCQTPHHTNLSTDISSCLPCNKGYTCKYV